MPIGRDERYEFTAASEPSSLLAFVSALMPLRSEGEAARGYSGLHRERRAHAIPRRSASPAIERTG